MMGRRYDDDGVGVRLRKANKNRVEGSMRRKRGRPPVESEDVHVRLTRSAVDALDAWIAAQPEPRPSRPEAIRRLLAEALGRVDDDARSTAVDGE
jgi:hypothetical protein